MNQQTVEYLLNNRDKKNVIDKLPNELQPKSLADAYQIQQSLVTALNEKHQSIPCGYKLACTNAMAMELLGIKAPFTGRLMTHSSFQSETSLIASNFAHRIAETEFMFELTLDVPDSDTAYTQETIQPYIGDCIASIEIVDHRFNDYTQVGAAALIADNAIHGASILGERSSAWQSLNLATHKVSLVINNTVFAEGTGKNVLGNPLNAMAWIANHLASRGTQLRAGDIVTTGTACAIYNAQAGDHLVGDFGALGVVEVKFI